MIPVRSRSVAPGADTSRDVHHAGPGNRLPSTFLSLRAPATRHRSGFTLFEVVLALGIFVGALAAISRIVDSGSRAAVRARLGNEAILRCESQMNQIVAGSVALESTDQSPFEDDPQWSWSLVLAEGPHVDLLSVEVVVTHVRPDGQVDAGFSLWRLMRNPELYLEASAAAAESAEQSTEE